MLSKKDRVSIDIEYTPGITIKECLHDIDLDKLKIIVKGVVVTDLNQKLLDNDEIILAPKIQDPVTIILVASAISSFISTVGSVVSFLTVVATLASIGYSIYSALSSKPKSATRGSQRTGGIEDGSPTYGWSGIQLLQEYNIPIGVVMGKHRIGGNIINAYIETIDDNNYLYILIALCEGPVSAIDNILINENPIENYDEVEIFKRYGTPDQQPIQGFDKVHLTTDLNITIDLTSSGGLPYIYTTSRSDVFEAGVYIFFPQGIYVNDWNGVQPYTARWTIEYKKRSTDVWSDPVEYSLRAKTRNPLRRVNKIVFPEPGQYDIRITKTAGGAGLTHVSDMTLQSIDEIVDQTLTYANTALLGVKILATSQLNGNIPNFTTEVSCSINQPQIMNGASEVDWDDYYYEEGTDTYKLLSDDSSLTWDGTSYVDKYTSNPIWLVKNLLCNARYGLGDYINTSLLDEDIFLEMAQYCETKVLDGTETDTYEKRFHLDCVLDSNSKALDILIQLGSSFRGFPFYSNGVVQYQIDKPGVAVQTFGMGNIIDKSFSETWLPSNEIPNVAEVQFLNATNEYRQESVFIEDEDVLNDGAPRKINVVRVLCSRMSQAVREGRYALRVAKYCDRLIEFKASIDAVVCQAGDLIDVSHDMPQIGFSGRVVSGTSQTVTLDREVSIESGKTYQIFIRHEDGSTETKTVTSGVGNYTTLSISSDTFTQSPANYDVFVFGETNILKERFRITSIRRYEDCEVEIKAVKYNEAIYDDTEEPIPDIECSVLDYNLPNVLNLNLTEEIYVKNDGTVENRLDIWFMKPIQNGGQYIKRYDRARLYISEDGTNWEYKGETRGEHFAVLDNVESATTYYVAVVSVSLDNTENLISTSPQSTITIIGKSAIPDNVTGFDVSQLGTNLRMLWDPVSNLDLSHYRIKRGNDWESADVVINRVDTTNVTIPVSEIGAHKYMIKAVDTSGNESDLSANDDIVIDLKDTSGFEATFDFWGHINNLLTTNLSKVFRPDYSKSYTRPVLAFITADTWEDIESLSKTWEQLETDGDLVCDDTFETSGSAEMVESIDLGTKAGFKVVADPDYISNGQTLTIQISYLQDDGNYSTFANLNTDTVYYARHFKFKLLFGSSDSTKNIYLYGLKIYFEALDILRTYGRDISISSSGETISYGADYSTPPIVTANIINGVTGIVIINNKTTSQFEIQVFNLSGTAIGTAEIDWFASGV